MPRDSRRPPPAPPDAHPHEEPLPPPPKPGAWPPGAPVPLADRQHQPRRLALALTRASGLALAVAVTAALLVVTPTGTGRESIDRTRRELPGLLEPGEPLLAYTIVSRRRPTDLWRRSYGLLAATSQRVLYVRAAPRPLLRPADPGPRVMLVRTWPIDARIVVDSEPFAARGSMTVISPTGASHFRAEDISSALDVLRAAYEQRPPTEGDRARDSTSY